MAEFLDCSCLQLYTSSTSHACSFDCICAITLPVADMPPTMLSFILAWLVIGSVQCVNFVPQSGLKVGDVVTKKSQIPAKKAFGQEKIYQASTFCSKNVALGCPGVELLPKPGYTPTANGCGPDNPRFTKFNSLINTTFVYPCCVAHDMCFGSCNADFDMCNSQFQQCLNDRCDQGSYCSIVTPLYYAGVANAASCS